MKFLVFAFILALMVSMIGADSSEEYGYGPYQPVPEQPLYPQPYQPQYQQYPF
ncbi:STATH isoform 4 [Pan troglodytes]|uniref:Statherin n=2 Tax=Pan troglodytes TaxID=9598 RepID=H2RA45_PANTR|nr:STATH isoform 4 [Pan troglodytes]